LEAGRDLVDALLRKGSLQEFVVLDDVMLQLGFHKDLLGVDNGLLRGA
jgi:hypothetical protein